MTSLLLFAQLGLPDGAQVAQIIIRALAVAGVALVGYVGTWLLVTVLARLTYGGKVPKPVSQVLQGAGGLTSGVLAFMLLFGNFGSGGPGPGGPGPGGGGGTGTGGTASVSPPTVPDKPSVSPSTGGTVDPSKGEVLQVEILPKGGLADPIYRIKGEEKPYNWKELRDEIDKRREQNKDLKKLEILHYENSPDVLKQQVKELERLAKLKDMIPSITKMDGNAP